MPRLYYRDPADQVLKPLLGGVVGKNEVAIASATPVDAGVELWVKQDEDTTASMDARYINAAGDSMTGPFVLYQDPASPLEAASMRYVDYRERAYSVQASPNWNNVVLPGPHDALMFGGDPNGPGTGYYYYVTVAMYGGTATDVLTTAHTQNITQFATPYNGGPPYWRWRYGGTWSPWQVLSSGPVDGSGWINVTFENGWVNYGPPFDPAQYMRVGKIVFMKGLVKSGTIGANICTLPAGYRPSSQLIISAVTNPNTAGRIDVLTSGGIQANAGSNGWLSLSNVTFLADA